MIVMTNWEGYYHSVWPSWIETNHRKYW